ncbi:hypothetical protein D3C75_585410 [compost metagenome]
MYRLPEHLDCWHSPHILYGRGINLLQCFMIRSDPVPALAACHQRSLNDKAEYNRQQTGNGQQRAQPEHDADHQHGSHRRTDQIGQLVGNKGFHLFHILLQRFFDSSGGGAVQVTERQPAQMLRHPYAQIVLNPESCKM